ncbi:MAG: hypothetical protein AAB903_03380 [Patescibacteria group bacterium]
MPTQVLPTPEEFTNFTTRVVRLGFRGFLFNRPTLRPKEGESSAKFPRTPTAKKGRELGFFFRSKDPENQYVVFIWTTWLIREQRARDQDAGWVLIVGNGKRLYVTEIRRTKYFLERVLEKSGIAQTRVIGRQRCPLCKNLMEIKWGRALGQRYWTCQNVDEHPDHLPQHESWDVALSDEQRAIVERIRRRRRQRRKRLRKEGKSPQPARLRRRTWEERTRG